jgi:thioredoxin 1
MRVTDRAPRTCHRACSDSVENAMLYATDASFKTDVIESDVPVLVDFWAPWCGPCRAVAPVLEALDAELAGRAKIVKVNVDENQVVAGALGVRSIPTLVVFKGGQAVEDAVGALSMQELKRLLEPHLAAA